MNSGLQSDTGPSTNYKLIIAQFRGLDNDPTNRRPQFNSRANSMEFMLDTTALQQDYLQFSANHHSINTPHLDLHIYNRPSVCGRPQQTAKQPTA